MSEDYSDCPRCERMHERKIELAEIEVRDAYGKVTHDKFVALQRKVEDLRGQTFEESLVVNYEHYFTEQGMLRRRFSCSCEKCGFFFKAKDVEETCHELGFRDSDLVDDDDD